MKLTVHEPYTRYEILFRGTRYFGLALDQLTWMLGDLTSSDSHLMMMVPVKSRYGNLQFILSKINSEYADRDILEVDKEIFSSTLYLSSKAQVSMLISSLFKSLSELTSLDDLDVLVNILGMDPLCETASSFPIYVPTAH